MAYKLKYDSDADVLLVLLKERGRYLMQRRPVTWSCTWT
jgi:hypothetical protein